MIITFFKQINQRKKNVEIVFNGKYIGNNNLEISS